MFGPIVRFGLKAVDDQQISRNSGTYSLARIPRPSKTSPIVFHTPFKWRGWWDFGTGALAIWPPTLNMPFMGLDLFDPTSVVAETSGHNKETYPAKCRITFEFPAYKGREALTMYWYDGGEKPDRSLFPKRSQFKDKNGKEIVADTKAYARLLNTGSLVVGDKGSFFSPGDYGQDARHTGVLQGDDFTLIGDIDQSQFPEPQDTSPNWQMPSRVDCSDFEPRTTPVL